MDRLKSAYSKFRGTRKKAVQFIFDHPEIAAFLSIDALAKKIGISTSSLSRTAVGIGYSGFPEMQTEVQEHLRQKLLPVARMEQAAPKSGIFSFRDSLQKDIHNVEKILETIHEDQFEGAVTLLTKAKEVFVVGLGTQYPSAIYFSGVMKQIRERVTLITLESMDYLDCFSRFSPHDLLISICLPRYGRFTVRTVKKAAEKGCRVLAITDNPLSPTGKLADVVLPVEYESMSFFNSNVAVMALLNSLATAAALKDRSVSRERIKTFSDMAADWDVFFSENSIQGEQVKNDAIKRQN